MLSFISKDRGGRGRQVGGGKEIEKVGSFTMRANREGIIFAMFIPVTAVFVTSLLYGL